MTARSPLLDDPFDQAVLDAPPDRRADMLTRLTRAARDRPRGASARRLRRLLAEHIDRLADEALTVALETGEPMAKLLANAIRRRKDPTLARRVADGLRAQHPALIEIGTACWTVIVRTMLRGDDPSHPDFPLRMADAVGELVGWLDRAGRHGAAVAIIRRGLALLRRHRMPTPFALLCQYGGVLAAKGDLAEAERWLRHALASAERQDAVPLDMVEEWINLATVRSNLGDRDGALDASRYAVHLLLRARGSGDRALEHLPSALGNHALFLLEVERPVAAQAAITHALALVERKTNRDPDANRPELVDALINASSIFTAAGDMAKARNASARAVAEARLLTGFRSARHAKALVLSLINHAIDLERLGEAEFAFEMAEQAADLARRIGMAHDFMPIDLEIDALSALCHIGLQGEFVAQAQQAGTAALALLEDLPEARRRPHLLELLPNLSDVLAKAGDGDGALALAVRAHATLLEAEADGLADAELRIGIRDTYAKRLSEQGDAGAAVRLAREAMDAIRAARDAGLISAAPAHAMVHLAGRLSDLGDLDGALDMAREGVAMVRGLAGHDPDWATAELPVALHTLARTHWLRGELDDACAVTGEMVVLNRHRMTVDERASLDDLASSLEFDAVLHNAAGRLDQARAGIAEAIPLFERLVDLGGAGFTADLANALHNDAVIALAAGDLAAAIASQERAIAALDRLESWDVHARKLAADSLANLSVYLTMAERVGEGLDATARALDVIGDLAGRWLPAVETAINVKVARARLLLVAERPDDALELSESALAAMDELGTEGDAHVWRGPALNVRAMARTALEHPQTSDAVAQALAFHRDALNAGSLDDVHGFCDAAAVAVDSLMDRKEPVSGLLEDILDRLEPWMDRLPPPRLASATVELVRACGAVPVNGLTLTERRRRMLDRLMAAQTVDGMTPPA
ncbi:hypothetical protein ABMY26_00965 [Azospirillum sp. HJ39]|uniref:hypothetical protein n=1 Tax=Azospirillum sp. HJ39 TaxID=3159496 RepID=UPI003556C95B